jgi:hypothetical protein
MLIDNKFIFLSIPRTASSSFHISCVRNNLNIKFAKESNNNQYYDLSLSNEDLIKSVIHPHEPIHELDIIFGVDYDIVAIKRDRHQRFLSLWKFVIKRSKIYGDVVYEIVKSLTIEDILIFDSSKLNKKEVHGYIDLFLIKHNLVNKVDEYFRNLLFILWQPTSMWHNNDTRIKWFDFDKLNEMEEWVSNKLNKSFKLLNFNSSKGLDLNLTIDDNFIKNYNKIYNTFDLSKNEKTLI